MSQRSITWARRTRLCLVVLAATALPATGEQPPARPMPDETKVKVVESSTSAVVRGASRARDAGKDEDVTKRLRIEKPAAAVVDNSAATRTADANPKVEPGKVKWHATFDDACAAAKKSGKPVLLLHMMGRLDLQFC